MGGELMTFDIGSDCSLYRATPAPQLPDPKEVNLQESGHF